MYSDYGITTNNLAGEAGAIFGAGLAGFIIVFVLIALAIAAFCVIITWKVFQKANKPGWAALIPIYSQIVLFDIIGFKWYYVLILMGISAIPGIGGLAALFFTIVYCIKLAKSFGQSTGFGIGLALVNPIFMGIIAFNKEIKYNGPVVNGDIDFNDLF